MDGSRFARYAPLAAAILLAAILQTILIARVPTISADGIIFIGIARELPEGPIESFRKQDQHPGYPALLLGATRLVQALGYTAEPQAWAAGGVIVSFACGLLSVWVVWLLARDLFDTRVANIAAVVFAVLPVPRLNAADAHSDTPHVLFYLLAAWLASTAVISGRLLPLAGAGLASALAYWIRPEGLEVALVAVVCLVWQAFRAHWSWRRLGLALGALAGSAAVVAAPYPILAGKFTSKQLPFAKVNPPPTFLTQQAAQTAPLPDPGIAPVAAAPHQVAAEAMAMPPQAPAEPAPTRPRYAPAVVLKVLVKALDAFIYCICQGFKFVFIPLYLVGHIELVRRRPDWLRIAMMALLGALHIAILLTVFMISGYIAHRHVIPLVALAMPFAALGILYIGGLLSRVFKVQPVYPVLATLGISCVVVLPYTLRVVNREFVPVIEAARWVQERTGPGMGIVSNSPYVGFYAGTTTAFLCPDAPTLEQAMARTNSQDRFEYVILHVNAHAYRTQWFDEVSTRYEPIHEIVDPLPSAEPRKVVVFRARDTTLRQAARPERQ